MIYIQNTIVLTQILAIVRKVRGNQIEFKQSYTLKANTIRFQIQSNNVTELK